MSHVRRMIRPWAVIAAHLQIAAGTLFQHDFRRIITIKETHTWCGIPTRVTYIQIEIEDGPVVYSNPDLDPAYKAHWVEYFKSVIHQPKEQ